MKINTPNVTNNYDNDINVIQPSEIISSNAQNRPIREVYTVLNNLIAQLGGRISNDFERHFFRIAETDENSDSSIKRVIPILEIEQYQSADNICNLQIQFAIKPTSGSFIEKLADNEIVVMSHPLSKFVIDRYLTNDPGQDGLVSFIVCSDTTYRRKLVIRYNRMNDNDSKEISFKIIKETSGTITHTEDFVTEDGNVLTITLHVPTGFTDEDVANYINTNMSQFSAEIQYYNNNAAVEFITYYFPFDDGSTTETQIYFLNIYEKVYFKSANDIFEFISDPTLYSDWEKEAPFVYNLNTHSFVHRGLYAIKKESDEVLQIIESGGDPNRKLENSLVFIPLDIEYYLNGNLGASRPINKFFDQNLFGQSLDLDTTLIPLCYVYDDAILFADGSVITGRDIENSSLIDGEIIPPGVVRLSETKFDSNNFNLSSVDLDTFIKNISNKIGTITDWSNSGEIITKLLLDHSNVKQHGVVVIDSTLAYSLPKLGYYKSFSDCATDFNNVLRNKTVILKPDISDNYIYDITDFKEISGCRFVVLGHDNGSPDFTKNVVFNYRVKDGQISSVSTGAGTVNLNAIKFTNNTLIQYNPDDYNPLYALLDPSTNRFIFNIDYSNTTRASSITFSNNVIDALAINLTGTNSKTTSGLNHKVIVVNNAAFFINIDTNVETPVVSSSDEVSNIEVFTCMNKTISFNINSDRSSKHSFIEFDMDNDYILGELNITDHVDDAQYLPTSYGGSIEYSDYDFITLSSITAPSININAFRVTLEGSIKLGDGSATIIEHTVLKINSNTTNKILHLINNFIEFWDITQSFFEYRIAISNQAIKYQDFLDLSNFVDYGGNVIDNNIKLRITFGDNIDSDTDQNIIKRFFIKNSNNHFNNNSLLTLIGWSPTATEIIKNNKIDITIYNFIDLHDAPDDTDNKILFFDNQHGGLLNIQSYYDILSTEIMDTDINFNIHGIFKLTNNNIGDASGNVHSTLFNILPGINFTLNTQSNAYTEHYDIPANITGLGAGLADKLVLDVHFTDNYGTSTSFAYYDRLTILGYINGGVTEYPLPTVTDYFSKENKVVINNVYVFNSELVNFSQTGVTFSFNPFSDSKSFSRVMLVNNQETKHKLNVLFDNIFTYMIGYFWSHVTPTVVTQISSNYPVIIENLLYNTNIHIRYMPIQRYRYHDEPTSTIHDNLYIPRRWFPNIPGIGSDTYADTILFDPLNFLFSHFRVYGTNNNIISEKEHFISNLRAKSSTYRLLNAVHISGSNDSDLELQLNDLKDLDKSEHFIFVLGENNKLNKEEMAWISVAFGIADNYICESTKYVMAKNNIIQIYTRFTLNFPYSQQSYYYEYVFGLGDAAWPNAGISFHHIFFPSLRTVYTGNSSGKKLWSENSLLMIPASIYYLWHTNSGSYARLSVVKNNILCNANSFIYTGHHLKTDGPTLVDIIDDKNILFNTIYTQQTDKLFENLHINDAILVGQQDLNTNSLLFNVRIPAKSSSDNIDDYTVQRMGIFIGNEASINNLLLKDITFKPIQETSS